MKEETKQKISRIMKRLFKEGKLHSQFKKGDIPWNKSLTKEIDVRLKIQGEKESKTKKRLFSEGILKPTKYWLGKKQSEETKIKRGIYKSYPCSNKTKQILREKNLGKKNPFYNKIHSKENLNKISKASIERWNDEEYKESTRKKISNGLLRVGDKISKNQLRVWNSSKEYKEQRIKNILKGLSKRPTSYEKRIAELCIENSLPFIYTGDGRFLINYKNPDFVNHKDKIVIEVFYSWFKIKGYGSVKKYKEFCRKKYNPLGWKVIFIDENEVDVDDWKVLCLNKIRSSL